MRKILLSAMLLVSGCGTTLQGGLSEGEANEILLVLAGAGIGGDKNATGKEWAVEVADSDLSAAFRVLSAAGLPRPRHTGFLGVYKERGLVPGRMEEQALYLSALQEEISKTLESVEGVVSARVHVTAKAEGKFQKAEASAPTASVLIGYYSDAAARPPISANEVKQIVANAVVGLERDRVAVVFSEKRKVAVPVAVSRAEGSGGLLRVAAAALAALAFCVSAFFLLRRRRRVQPATLRHRRTAA
jgi:type III secretion protein J